MTKRHLDRPSLTQGAKETDVVRQFSIQPKLHQFSLETWKICQQKRWKVLRKSSIRTHSSDLNILPGLWTILRYIFTIIIIYHHHHHHHHRSFEAHWQAECCVEDGFVDQKCSASFSSDKKILHTLLSWQHHYWRKFGTCGVFSIARCLVLRKHTCT